MLESCSAFLVMLRLHIAIQFLKKSSKAHLQSYKLRGAAAGQADTAKNARESAVAVLPTNLTFGLYAMPAPYGTPPLSSSAAPSGLEVRACAGTRDPGMEYIIIALFNV